MIDILRISVPLTVWLPSFSAIYGLEGVLCSNRSADAFGFLAGRAPLVAAWLIAIAIQVAMLTGLRSRRFASPSPFIRSVSVPLAVTSLVATIWTAFPVMTLSRCL